MHETPYCVVLVTVDDSKTAAKLSKALLDRHLAACVSRVPGLVSEYWWEGKLEKADEQLLVIKTRAALVPDVTQCVRETHPASVPEVLSLPVIGGNKAYLEWVGANTLFTKPQVRPRTDGQ